VTDTEKHEFLGELTELVGNLNYKGFEFILRPDQSFDGLLEFTVQKKTYSKDMVLDRSISRICFSVETAFHSKYYFTPDFVFNMIMDVERLISRKLFDENNANLFQS